MSKPDSEIPRLAVFAQSEEKMKRKKLARLQNLATILNYQPLPNQ